MRMEKIPNRSLMSLALAAGMLVILGTAKSLANDDVCELLPPVDPNSPVEWERRIALQHELYTLRFSSAAYALQPATPPVTQPATPPASRPANEPANKPAEPQRFGEAPPDDSRVFLRQSAVLLKPGTWEVEYGVRYTLQENAFLTILPDSSIVPEMTDSRQFLGTLSLRYGLSPRLQPFVTLPVGASFYERSNALGEDVDDAYGLGDILAGVNYLWRDGKNERADIISSFSVSAPTGPATIGGLTANQASLGSGFCTINVNTTAIWTLDPVVLFASLGYSHQFATSYQGVNVQPGEQFSGSFGVGFAVNDDLTLSAELQTIVQLDFAIAGMRVPDTGLESTLLRYSVVKRICEKEFVEFSVIHGLTDDAPSVSVSALRTRRF
jgi:hypothetical protein